MKIIISNIDPSGSNGLNIYESKSGKILRNMRNNIFVHDFDENDIIQVLSKKDKNKFLSGEKYEFNLSKKQIFLLTDDFSYYSKSFANDRDVLNRN